MLFVPVRFPPTRNCCIHCALTKNAHFYLADNAHAADETEETDTVGALPMRGSAAPAPASSPKGNLTVDVNAARMSTVSVTDYAGPLTLTSPTNPNAVSPTGSAPPKPLPTPAVEKKNAPPRKPDSTCHLNDEKVGERVTYLFSFLGSLN